MEILRRLIAFYSAFACASMAVTDKRFVGDIASEYRTGEADLLDLGESKYGRQIGDGTFIIFLGDDHKGKNVIFKWNPTQVN